MNLVDEFRRRADECRDLAKKAMNEDHRTLILGMAETWDILARQRQVFLERNPEASQSAELPWRKVPLN